MKILVSVRNAEEALLAARAGVHFIDLKEPSRGALGGLDVAQIGPIVAMLRLQAPGAAVSATIGDFPAEALAAISAQAQAVAACGVDYVKVGVLPGPAAGALLAHLARLRAVGMPVVPVLIADDGLPAACVGPALAGSFPAVMLDTADKLGGSLFDRVDEGRLAAFVRDVQARGALSGLAGALRNSDLDRLRRTGTDFAGFRSAVCVSDRSAAMDAGLLRRLLHPVAQNRAIPAEM